MYAVIKTGGKQAYRVAQGQIRLRVEKLTGNVGDVVTLGEVLLVGSGDGVRSALRWLAALRSRRRSSARTVPQGHHLQVPSSQELPPEDRSPSAVRRARDHRYLGLS